MDERTLASATNMIRQHEGLRLKMYQDTYGHYTIGVGHNLDSCPISEDAAMHILRDDISSALEGLHAMIPLFASLTGPRQAAILDMAFNLGVGGVFLFAEMWKAIADKNWQLAAQEMLDSKWAGQVGERAHDLARIMRTGSF